MLELMTSLLQTKRKSLELQTCRITSFAICPHSLSVIPFILLAVVMKSDERVGVDFQCYLFTESICLAVGFHESGSSLPKIWPNFGIKKFLRIALQNAIEIRFRNAYLMNRLLGRLSFFLFICLFVCFLYW